jgi:hypothetical protein
LKEPLGFVFRSPRWRRRTLAGVLCFGFAWLLVPGLLLLGYLVELSRQVRDGNPQLPSWDQRWLKIKDGFAVATLFVIWSLPGLGLLLIAGILADPTIEVAVGSVSGRVSYVVYAIGNVWLFLVLVTQVAVWAQYLRGGFRAALRLSAIVDRLRFNLSLTVVMAGLTMILLVIGAVGLIGLLIGVVATLTYMSYVWAYLAGKHAHLTDPVKPTIGTLVSSPRGRAQACSWMPPRWAVASQVASQQMVGARAEGLHLNTEGEGFEPPKACTLVVFKTGVALFISVRRRSPSFDQYT